jgi:DNA-binding GntR family transcriptional regulator
MNETPIAFRRPDALANELARALEEQIIYGELPPETRLVEEEVAQRFGISRSPVREALRILEQGGLVLREARRGIWVAPIGRADLDSVYSCRVALEGLAAEQAARARQPADLEALKAAFAAMEQATDIRAYFRANVAFTEAVHAAAGNPTLKRLLASIGKQALRYRFLAYSRAPALIKRSLAGNRELLAAIVESRPSSARLITEDLIRGSWDAVGRAVDEEIAAAAARKQAAR